MSLNIVNPTTGQTTKVAGEFDTTAIEEITEQLTASDDTPFRFGYDETTGKYGYIINEGGADTVIPFKTVGTRSGAITSNGTYTASSDISEDGYESVVVSVPNSTQTKTVTAGTSNVTVSPDSGYIGMSSVTVKPTPSQSKSATPSTTAQTISPDSGKLLSSVSISAISTQEKSVTSSRSAQTVTPDSGKYLSKVTVNALAPTGTYAASSRGNSLDMGATSNYRYVNTNGVPNSNTETYTFPANDTGGTKDLGATNNYRYVNAGNVYNKGKADGGSGKATINVSYISEGSSTTGITFSATSGRVYAVVFGGKNGDNPSGITGSGYTQLGYRQRISDSAGAAIAIIQATAASVTINTNATFPYQGSVIVMQITS